MLSTPSIEELSTTRPDLFAFKINGEVSKEDMRDMAQHMNDAFDAHSEVDMLLYFEDFKGAAPDAGLSLEAVQSQLRALSSVRRYVVANAPEQASDLVEAMGKLLPVEAEAFDGLDAAFKSLGATSMVSTSRSVV